jgi:CheY-like chemotaxis protein
LATRTILLADEDTDTRIILRTVLERNGFAVVDTDSGAGALAAVCERQFDLVILNHPVYCPDGRTLARTLRSGSLTSHVPILNIMSRFVPQLLQDAVAEGVDHSMAKPVDVEAVLEVVRGLSERTPVAAH